MTSRYGFKDPNRPQQPAAPEKLPPKPADAINTTERVFEYIHLYITEHGYSPTLKEISTACYISTGSLVRHLDKLEHSNRITREYRKARSIRIIKEG